jgi:hypothetical protein
MTCPKKKPGTKELPDFEARKENQVCTYSIKTE